MSNKYKKLINISINTIVNYIMGDVAIEASKEKRKQEKEKRKREKNSIDNTKIGDILGELESGRYKVYKYFGKLTEAEKKNIEKRGYSVQYKRYSNSNYNHHQISPSIFKLRLNNTSHYHSARTSLDNYQKRQSVIDMKKLDGIMKEMESGNYSGYACYRKFRVSEIKYLKKQGYRVKRVNSRMSFHYMIKPKQRCYICC